MDKVGSPIDNKLNLANNNNQKHLAKDGAKNLDPKAKNLANKKTSSASKTSKSTNSSSSSAKSASSKAKSGDYSVNLSDKSKSLATELAKEAAKSKIVDTILPGENAPIPKNDDKNKLSDAEKELKANEAKEIEKAKKKKKAAKKPAIFFVGGMELSGTSSERYGGIKGMAEAVKGARLYGWDQQGKMIDEIGKRNKDQPVILVGHSFGGDSAVEVANELNTLEHGFRKVDLLVTIDSVGANNDIIPTNVKKNLNYFSEDIFLSDEPNVARNAKKTDVQNFLQTEGHTEIDDQTEVQSDILDAISDIVP